MKRKFAFIMVLCMLFGTLSGISYAQQNDPGSIPEHSDAYFEPYAESLKSTRYAPWFSMYHMQSEAEAAIGRRAGEGGQIIMSFAMSPVDSDLMLMGTDMSGLWGSYDGGKNWVSINNNIYMWSVPDITFHPTQAQTAYLVQTAKNAPDKITATTLDGVYKTTDAGKTWEQVLSADIAVGACGKLLQFDAAGNLYALTGAGVQKTTDGGASWENLGGVQTSSNVWDLDVSQDGSTILAAQADGLWASFDGGETWSAKNGGMSGSVTSIAVDPQNPDHYLAVFGGTDKGLYESFDKGETWSKQNEPGYASKNTPVKIEFGPTGRLYLIYSQMAYPLRVSENGGDSWITPKVANQDIATKGTTGYYAEGIVFDPQNPEIVFYSFGDIIYRSTDGGKNFAYSSSGYSGNYVNEFTFAPDGTLYFAFVDKGLGVTTSPYQPQSLPAMQMIDGIGRYKDARTVGSVALNPHKNGHILIALGEWAEQILSESHDGGKTWTQIAGAESDSAYRLIRFHPEDEDIIYTSHVTSYDGGETWEENEVTILAVSGADPDVVYGKSGKGMYRSRDCGQTWTKIAEMSDPRSAVADVNDPDVAFVGCYNGSVVKIDGNSITTFDEGDGLVKGNGAACLMEAIAQNPKNPNHLLCGGRCTANGTRSPGLYESLDGGETWHVVPGLPSNRIINSIAFSKNSNEALLGTYYGTIRYEYDKFDYDAYLAGFQPRTIAIDAQSVGRVSLENPTQNTANLETDAYAVDQIATNEYNGVQIDDRLFYKASLESNADKRIVSATLKITGRREKYGARLSIYPVSEGWDADTICYQNSPQTGETPVIAQTVKPETAWTTWSFDITDYVASLDLSTDEINLMLKAEPERNNPYGWLYSILGVQSARPPQIVVEYEMTYPITLSSGDGETQTLSCLAAGETLSIPQNPFQKTGCRFAGWSDGVHVYLPGETFAMPSHPVTFTALWETLADCAFYTPSQMSTIPAEEVYVLTDADGTTTKYVNQASSGGGYHALNVNSTGATSRLYYRLDTGRLRMVTSAVLTLNIAKINMGGSFYIYEVIDGFGTDSPEIAENAEATASAGYNAVTGSFEIDVTELVKRLSDAGKEELLLYVEYRSTTTKPTQDGARVHSVAAQGREPVLTVACGMETDTLIAAPITAIIHTNLEQTQFAQPVLAYYEDGMLIKTVVGTRTNLLQSPELMLTIDLSDKEIDEGSELRAYLWDGTASCAPLSTLWKLRKNT